MITVGAIGPGSILLVVHPFYVEQGKRSSASFRLALLSRTKGKLMRRLTREQERDIRAIAAKKEGDIDFSDAAPVLDWSAAEIGKFYHPPKRPVTMRLDCDVISWLKEDGPGYQTKANWLLRQAMNYFRKRTSHSERGTTQRVAKARSREL